VLCSIIPYSRSFDDTLLTYSLPEEFRPFVKVGSSVHIPWGNDTILGIVADVAVEIPYEGEIKPITGPHCTTPWLSSSEISLLIQIARTLFVRLHTVAQLFLPLGVFGLFEKENFLSLTPPVNSKKIGESEYIIAPDEESLKSYLWNILSEKPGAVILPEWLSVKSWSGIFPESLVDHHPKSISTQKRIYIDILSGEFPVLFGTRRTLTKRLWHYPNIYLIYDTMSSEIMFGQRSIPLWMMAQMLEAHWHVIHYITTTPSVRILCDFLQNKKPIHYL
jgi:3'DNA-binding domain (3'BD)